MSESVRIAGRYELVGAPLRGSMGELFRAYDVRLDREVAVKVIHRDLLGGDVEEELRRRFRREARLLARAAHPGVPTVFDFGHDEGRDFVVMELVHGATIGDLINEVVPVPIPWIAFITAQLGVTLAWAHRQSLVHRDLKPDNIILCHDGLVRIVDFGMAIASDGLSSRLTPPGATAGDASYQAPERQLGLSTPRTDLYAVGRVMQDMLRHHPSVPSELETLVSDLLQELPQNRPAGAEEVERRVRPLLEPLFSLPGFVDRAPPEPIRRYAELTARLRGLDAVDGIPRPTGSAIDLDARQARALAEEQVREGRHTRALWTLERAIERADRSDLLAAELRRDLATVLLEMGETTGAIVACQDAIMVMRLRLPADHPAVLGTLLALARAHAAQGNTEGAASIYLTVLEARNLPDTVTPRQELAVQYAAAGEHERALELLEGIADELVADRDLVRLAAVEADLSRVRFVSGATEADL